MNAILVGAIFAIFGATVLVLNLRRGTLPFGIKASRFAYISISIVPPAALCAFGAGIALWGLFGLR